MLLALLATLLVGCKGPYSKPGHLMTEITRPGPVAAGKSQVLIHRPRSAQGHALKTGIWDGKKFLGDLGNGNSLAYDCEPGIHYFINRSVERVGVVKAELLPGHTYGLWLNIAGAWIASFQIEPLKPGTKQWKKADLWAEENRWVARTPAADAHEQERQAEIELILKDFVGGEKQDRLRQLAPNEHR